MTSTFIKGQRVLYVPTHAQGDRDHADCERGVVKAVRSDGAVLVLYDNAQGIMLTGDEPYTPQATDAADLVLL